MCTASMEFDTEYENVTQSQIILSLCHFGALLHSIHLRIGQNFVNVIYDFPYGVTGFLPGPSSISHFLAVDTI